MKVGPKHIENKLYRKILSVMPVPCVDAVIVNGNSFLLGKRANKPVQGEWCVIGGRILKGESLENAVKRHVRAEAEISGLKIKKFLATIPTIFRDSAQGPSSHTINSVFLVEAKSKKFKASKENKELRWFSKIDKDWHPYVKEVLKLAGFD